MGMLVRLLYASRVAVALGSGGIAGLLARARRNNTVHGITGILCHSDELFIQALEGGRDGVSELFATILGDERHRGARLLGYEESCERRFGHWAMGEVDLGRVNHALVLKYSPGPALDPFAMPAAATMALLDELAATAAIVNRGG